MSYKAYRLTETERGYLETGDPPGSYSPAEIEQRIGEKVGLIPIRFNHLFDDIELLLDEGYLNTEMWADGWLKLMGVDQPVTEDALESAFIRSPDEKEYYSRGTSPGEFGHELGAMVSRLMLYPPVVERKEMLDDLSWGFLRAVYDYVKEPIPEALGVFEERSEAYAERTQNIRELSGIMENSLIMNYERTNDYIENVLESEDIPPAPKLKKEIRDGLGGYKKMQEVSADDRPIEEVIPPARIIDVIEEKRLVEKYQLQRCLEIDAERVTKKGESPSAHAVLGDIFENGSEKNSSREVAQRLADDKDWTARVTRVARDLVGDKTKSRGWEKRDVFEHRPLLRGEKGGWKTTAYGEALGWYLQEGESVIREISPLYHIPDAVVEAALDEFKAINLAIPDVVSARDKATMTGFRIGKSEDVSDE